MFHLENNQLNTKAWLSWFGAMFITIFLVKNPLYLVVVFLIEVAVFVKFRQQSDNQIWFTFFKLGLVFALVSVLFNVLTSRFGETTLFTIPSSVPLIDGKITLEALVYGLNFGLFFLDTLLLFAIFNLVIDYYRLLKSIPQVFAQIGLVTSISLSFIPQTTLAYQEIREAQAIRGLKEEKGLLKRFSNLQALFVPLIITGLEKALTLAESLETKGYGYKEQKVLDKRLLFLALLGLSVGLGLIFFNLNQGYLAILLSFVFMVAALVKSSKGSKTTHLKREEWQLNDSAVFLSSLTVGLSFLVINFAQKSLIFYWSYPKVTVPDFNLLINLLLLLLILPAVIG